MQVLSVLLLFDVQRVSVAERVSLTGLSAGQSAGPARGHLLVLFILRLHHGTVRGASPRGQDAVTYPNFGKSVYSSFDNTTDV
jgi:hypothetical protein